MLTILYQSSLAVIVCAALWVVLDPRVHTGIIGAACAGGVAVFSAAACEGDPPNWLVGQTVSLAALCLWAAGRMAWRRSRIARRLRGL